MSNKIWDINSAKATDELKEIIKNPLLAKLLANRGIQTKVEAQKFLEPKSARLIEPSAFCDMEKSVERIKRAVENKEKILIWGDFDADGVTSSALLYKVFKAAGADFTNFIPHRKEHGHGLNTKELVKFISKDKIKLVITVDCGISDTKAIDLLNSFKIDTIITDHHSAPDILPQAYAILNPKAPNALSETLNVEDIASLCSLSGAGVAYKLSCALAKEFKEVAHINDELLCLAAVGTISDVVPLLGENRTLVALGLEQINQKKHKGIAAVFESAKRDGKITSTDVAFVLTPRINAAGRLDTPDRAYELLIEDNPLPLKIAVEYLDSYNKMRQNLCDETFTQISDMIKKDNALVKDAAIILLNPEWHVGIIGVVASSIVEAFLKPVFLMTKDDDNIIKCSIRSPLGYNIYEVLEKAGDCFLGFGGHAQAGGFSFDGSKFSFDEIKKKILDIFEDLYKNVKPKNKLPIDMELEAQNINKELLEVIACLEPCGEKNPTPVFCIKNAQYVSHRFVGKNSEHLKLECTKDGAALHCVWWGKNSFGVQKEFDIAFSPRLNVFNGLETIQLELEDTSLENNADSGIKFYDHRGKNDVLKQVDDYLANPEISVAIIAKKPATLNKISSYEHIFRRLYENEKDCNLMFFDYPPTCEEFAQTIKNANANKIHLMKEDFEEDIEFYLKQLTGMLKFCSNKKNGEITIEKMALSLGVSADFIQIALEIFEREGAVEILGENKISFIKPVASENFSRNAMYEILNDEFKKVMDFKNIMQEANVAQIEEIIKL